MARPSRVGCVGRGRTEKRTGFMGSGGEYREIAETAPKKGAPARAGALVESIDWKSSVHPAHAAAAGHARRRLILLLDLGDHRLGREHEPRDRSGVLESVLRHL